MEFKYPPPPVDQRPPEFLPHSPGNGMGYFSRQAVRAGFMGPTDMRHAPDVGTILPVRTETNQMREWNSIPGAVDNDDRNTVKHSLNLEAGPTPEWNHSLDAMRRQWEKQRIREEIIASEFERRRLLELEVRRELEQEMAMHRAAEGYSFQGRSSMWFDRRFSFVDRVDSQMMQEPWASGGPATMDKFPSRYPVQPFPGTRQSDIDAEARRSRTIMMAKPNPKLSGVKRKLITPPEESSQVPPSVRSLKLKEEHSCALCQVSATSAKGLQEHLQGKKHKMMEENLKLEKIDRKKAPNKKFRKGKALEGSRKDAKEETKEKSIPQPPEKSISQPPKKSIPQSLGDLKSSNNGTISKKDGPKLAPNVGIHPVEPSKKRQKNFRFWCECCGVGAHSEKVFEAHLNGKKHWLHLEMNKESDAAQTAT